MRSRLIAGGATVIEQAYATALAGGGDAKDPFEPVFDSESGRAVGFRIPPEVVSIG